MPLLPRRFERLCNLVGCDEVWLKDHRPPAPARAFADGGERSRLARCDAECAPAYLESSNPDNVPYYERFGFEVTGEIVIPDGPSLWPMWRNPR